MTTLEQKVASIEKSINELTIRARELGSQNNNLMTERDELQEKAAGIAAHVKALQAFKKNCQSFLDCRDDLPDVPITPEPPSAYRVPRYQDLQPLQVVPLPLAPGGAGELPTPRGRPGIDLTSTQQDLISLPGIQQLPTDSCQREADPQETVSLHPEGRIILTTKINRELVFLLKLEG